MEFYRIMKLSINYHITSQYFIKTESLRFTLSFIDNNSYTYMIRENGYGAYFSNTQFYDEYEFI